MFVYMLLLVLSEDEGAGCSIAWLLLLCCCELPYPCEVDVLCCVLAMYCDPDVCCCCVDSDVDDVMLLLVYCEVREDKDCEGRYCEVEDACCDWARYCCELDPEILLERCIGLIISSVCICDV
jgi:hypothetical protein